MTGKKYFAYGSNMFVRRLKERVPSATALGVYTLVAHDLRFHKHSNKDCSGKCDAYFTDNPSDAVIGRLFAIDVAEEDALDKIEGLGKGYEKKEVRVVGENGETETAFTYYADPQCINEHLRPFIWYKKHILVGAREAKLPIDYIKKIDAVAAVEDPDSARAEKELRLHD